MVAISPDTQTSMAARPAQGRPRWAGRRPGRCYTEVGDPVASGIAVANGVVYFTRSPAASWSPSMPSRARS